MNRRLFVSIVLPCLQRYAQAAPSAEATPYTVLEPPVPAAGSAKPIEVLEFFSYACPACRSFDPFVDPWIRRLPAGVVFRRVPVPFLYNAEIFQRSFFALEATDMIALMHRKLFDAVQVEKRRLAKPEEVAALVAASGGAADAFLAAFNSFSMGLTLARANATVAAYRIAQIPTMGVAGRFVTSPQQAGGASQTLAAVDTLVGTALETDPQSRRDRDSGGLRAK
jgi:protein dithiol oxidoreductase (disulfide-forming)